MIAGARKNGSERRQRSPKQLQALAPATAHVALERYEHQPARAFCRPALNKGPVATVRPEDAQQSRRCVCAAMCSAPATPVRHRCARLGRARRAAARHNLRSTHNSRRCSAQRGAMYFLQQHFALWLCGCRAASRRVSPAAPPRGIMRVRCAACVSCSTDTQRSALLSAPVGDQAPAAQPHRGAQRQVRRGAVRDH